MTEIMERLARILVILLLAGAVVIPIGGRLSSYVMAGVEIHGRTAEQGGWTPNHLDAQAGDPLELRLTSDDVIHGFAVGRHDAPEVEVAPGMWVTTSLVFDQPGTYTFYCTRWCGPGHWRMRGTIEVTGALQHEHSEDQEAPVSAPRYVRYGIDIDAPTPAAVVPEARPVASRGAQWADRLPAYALEAETYWSHSPAQLWQRLRDEPPPAELSDMEIWDLVAWIWAQQTTVEALLHAEVLYAQEGAAAHGETGQGDGVMVEGLSPYSYDFGEDGHGAIQPPDLTVLAHTLGASPARLEGKMLRGGMGTGMPAYGEIYTPEEIEALVAYFYTYVMDLDAAPAATP